MSIIGPDGTRRTRNNGNGAGRGDNPHRVTSTYLGYSHNGGASHEPSSYTHLFSSPTGGESDSIEQSYGSHKPNLEVGKKYSLDMRPTKGPNSAPDPAY
jgi:hypothetical protein